MTEKGKSSVKRGKFNLVDLLIILALILFVAIVVDLFLPTSLFSSFMSNDEREIQYTVEFLGVDQQYIENIKENDTVIDSVSKYSLGTVVTVANSDQYSKLYYDSATNTSMLSKYDDKYNVIVTVTVTAEYNEGSGYSVGDRRIAVGELLSLRFPDFAAEGYCIGLSETN